MLRTFAGIVIIALAVSAAALADGKYTITTAKSEPPKEVQEPIRKLLSDTSIRLLDDKNEVVGEIWLRKEVPAKATPEQVKNGLTYREVEEGTLFGVMRCDRLITDYRKQKVAPGVYTLRLGYQPMDGDHMGTAPYSEFFLLIPAAIDGTPEIPEPKQLREDSSKAVKTSHPGVLLLFPSPKPKDAPELQAKENNHWVLFFKSDVVVDKMKTSLGVGLTVIGHSTLE